MYIIIITNIIYIIKFFKTIKIIYIFNIINENIYFTNNIEFSFEYRFLSKICR